MLKKTIVLFALLVASNLALNLNALSHPQKDLYPKVSAQLNDSSAIYNGSTIFRNDYTFSSLFEISSGNELIATVMKSKLNINALYDKYGNYEALGSCRLFCLGTFYTWGTEIDIYDEDGNRIGVIDGQVASTEPAKFSFYDSENNLIAIAYLDKNRAVFSILDPINEIKPFARLSRNFVRDTVDY